MTITGLDHVNISTAKLAETRAFFVDILGLTEGWRPPFDFAGHWLYAGEKDVVHLAERAEAPRPSRGSALDHFAFRIDDFEATRARLDAAGIPYRELASPAGGIRQFFIADVNEAVIELNWRP